MTQNPLIIAETGSQRTLGYVLDVAQPDRRARCWLDVTEKHLNRHNVLHGGLVSLLLDSAMGATGSLSVDPAGKAPFLTVSFTVQFLAPASPGRVTAIGRVTGGGASLLFAEGELTDEAGQTLATATGVFKRVPSHALPEGSAL
jgi:acyl-coenzyme A thioesterase 13